jgi:hypothetical protein
VERKKPLKAKKGLAKKTILHARSSLKSKKGLTAKSTLKPRSKKMQETYKKRSAFVKQFLSIYPHCQARWDENCYTISVDVHEIIPRGVGGKIVDDNWDNFLAVCRYCHRQITDNPSEAQERGLRKWSWEK